jgi:hypothetical protein
MLISSLSRRHFLTGLSERLRADISKVTAHERIEHIYLYRYCNAQDEEDEEVGRMSVRRLVFLGMAVPRIVLLLREWHPLHLELIIMWKRFVSGAPQFLRLNS